MTLTDKQSRHIAELRRLGALSRERAVAAAPHDLSAMVLGKLRDLGLAQSRVRIEKKRQWTEYWLTDKGAEAGK